MRAHLDKTLPLNTFDSLAWVFILLMHEILFCDIAVPDLHLSMFHGRVCDSSVTVSHDAGICATNLTF